MAKKGERKKAKKDAYDHSSVGLVSFRNICAINVARLLISKRSHRPRRNSGTDSVYEIPACAMLERIEKE